MYTYRYMISFSQQTKICQTVQVQLDQLESRLTVALPEPYIEESFHHGTNARRTDVLQQELSPIYHSGMTSGMIKTRSSEAFDLK